MWWRQHLWWLCGEDSVDITWISQRLGDRHWSDSMQFPYQRESYSAVSLSLYHWELHRIRSQAPTMDSENSREGRWSLSSLFLGNSAKPPALCMTPLTSHTLFTLLPSAKRYRGIRALTARLCESFSFLHKPSGFLTNSDWTWTHTHIRWAWGCYVLQLRQGNCYIGGYFQVDNDFPFNPSLSTPVSHWDGLILPLLASMCPQDSRICYTTVQAL